jgi:ferrous iron transport protein A
MTRKPHMLSDLLPGDKGVVKAITPDDLSAKLVEMGVFEGKQLKVLYRAPFNGPIAVDVEGYTLSMREDEARLVWLEQ